MSSSAGLAIELVERGYMPDFVTRYGIRRRCRQRLRDEVRRAPSDPLRARREFADRMRGGPIAPVPECANDQHYELPAAFFQRVLGKYLKYSSGYWADGVTSLDQAEADGLRETCAHADLQNGQDVLELGCGWGSLSLWMAEHYPASTITSVSNSNSQREFIMGQARDRGLTNLNVITKDMNDFEIDRQFDRIVSVEMFEHMRNYELLLQRISNWLRPDGRLFVHIFCHRDYAYEFMQEGEDNWMGKYFFTGGIMPAEKIFDEFKDNLQVEEQWRWDGTHYQKTAEAWLENMDAHRDEIRTVFADVYGDDVDRWISRWRVFFLACAELFGYDRGQEWFVTHARLMRTDAS
ncbi:MAG: cyclopropane-fatty-acyl-phospholipid synthase family protein [Planctomycetota bacterium]